MKRVWIFGDSFADPNDNDDIEYNFTSWHKRLGNVTNFAKCSTGPHYSLKELYKLYNKFTKDDHIVFIISGRERIHFHVSDDYDSDIIPEDVMVDNNRGKISLYSYDGEHPKKQMWYDDNVDSMKYACKTFKEEIDTIVMKCESFLYSISRLQKCKVTAFLLDTKESYLRDRLNDDLFYLHNYSLKDASREEFTNFNANRFPKNELRKNHLSEENHDIMEDIVKTSIYKPFKKSFVDPTPFEVDKDRFIYD